MDHRNIRISMPHQNTQSLIRIPDRLLYHMPSQNQKMTRTLIALVCSHIKEIFSMRLILNAIKLAFDPALQKIKLAYLVTLFKLKKSQIYAFNLYQLE
jgi:hypothetical protein